MADAPTEVSNKKAQDITKPWAPSKKLGLAIG
jgi:hypothetical protein